MSFALGDIVTITGLAIKVHSAYKDAPDGYRHISEEVATLRSLIDKVARHFKSTNINSDDLYYGQKILKGCQGVLEDLSRLIEKHRKLASISKKLVITRVRLGQEDIATLQAKLISNTILLHGFVRRSVIPAILLHYYYDYDIDSSIEF